jgi:integrase
LTKSTHRGRGEGTIYRRGSDNRWCGTISVPSISGRRRKRRSYYGTTRKEVANQLTKALREQQQGFSVSSDKQTVEQFLGSWLDEHVRPSVRPITYETYKLLARVHIIPALGCVRLTELTPAHVQAFIADKLASGLGPQSVRHCRTVCDVP